MRRASANLPYEDDTFRADLSASVRDVVRKQVDVGIDVPSDGEFGKRGWVRYVVDRLAGLEYRLPAENETRHYADVMYHDRDRFDEFFRVYTRFEEVLWQPEQEPGEKPPIERHAWVNTGKISYRGHEAIKRDIENLKAALIGLNVADAFLPSVAPCSVQVIPAGDFYRSEEEYLFDVADALNQEYRAIVDAGLILQIDDAILPAHYNPKEPLQDYLQWAEVRIAAANQALKGIPAECVRYHICWGSQNVPHTWDVPLRDIVRLLLKLNVGAYSIEAANPRHEHEWTVWEFDQFAGGPILIPGMITHATNVVEHPELIAQRLENYARLVGRENVIAGTDCGFSQSWNIPRTHPQVQWAKLEALADGARLASARLWR